MKRLIILLTSIFFYGIVFSQTVIKKQDFEGGIGDEVWAYTSSCPYIGATADADPYTEDFWGVHEGWILGGGNSGFVARYNDNLLEDTLFFNVVDVSNEGVLFVSLDIYRYEATKYGAVKLIVWTNTSLDDESLWMSKTIDITASTEAYRTFYRPSETISAESKRLKLSFAFHSTVASNQIFFALDNIELTDNSNALAFTLTYDKGDAPDGTAPAAVTVKERENAILPGIEDMIYNGYVLTGWTDGTETYPVGTGYTMPSNDVTLVAVWAVRDFIAIQSFEGIIGDYIWTYTSSDFVGVSQESPVFFGLTSWLTPFHDNIDGVNHIAFRTRSQDIDGGKGILTFDTIDVTVSSGKTLELSLVALKDLTSNTCNLTIRTQNSANQWSSQTLNITDNSFNDFVETRIIVGSDVKKISLEFEFYTNAIGDYNWVALDNIRLREVDLPQGLEPIISQLSPVNNAADVNYNTALVAVFEEPIHFGTGNIIMKDLVNPAQSDTIDVSNHNWQLSITDNELRILSVKDFEYGGEYAVRIEQGAIEDFYNTPFVGIEDDLTWTFTVMDEEQHTTEVDTALYFTFVFTNVPDTEAAVQQIITTLGSPRQNSSRMVAFGMTGPSLLGQSVQEMNDIMNSTLDLAEKYDMPVYYQIDDVNNQFAGGAELAYSNDPAMVEWTDWEGFVPRYWFNWGSWLTTGAVPCLGSPSLKQYVVNQLNDGVLDPLTARINKWEAEGKSHLFAGICIGWETHIQDLTIGSPGAPSTMESTMVAGDMGQAGYHSLSYLGYTKESFNEEAGARGIPSGQLAKEKLWQVQYDFTELLSKTCYDAGISKDRIYTHIVSLESVNNYNTTNFPPIWTAVNKFSTPGFTMSNVTCPYNIEVLLDEIKANDPTQINFSNAEGYAAGLTTEAGTDSYFKEMYGNGAKMVTCFGYGGETPGGLFYVDKDPNYPLNISIKKWLDGIYSISFNRGVGVSGDAPVIMSAKMGDEVTLPDQGDMLKDGYFFIGWSDGLSLYQAGQIFVMPAENITLTAQWQEVGTDVSEMRMSDINIYPNPTDGTITINSLKSNALLKIFDISGQCVHQTNVNSNQMLKLNLKSGLYILNFETSTGNIKEKLIIK